MSSDEDLRAVVPEVLSVLVRRGADVADAEDAVQEALVETLRSPQPPADLTAWLVTVSWRKLVDAWRSDSARQAREERVNGRPESGPVEQQDDTLQLVVWCCHPSLTPASAVALTLRAVGGLTTRQIAAHDLRSAGDLRNVLKVVYLIFNEGYSGDVDLAEEAVRIGRMLLRADDAPEVRGLLALMLLHHARRAARWDADGLVPLDRQDRSRWDTALVAEGVDLLQSALAHDRLGEYQAQAAVAALHCDAAAGADVGAHPADREETDWTQIVGWYDELLRLTPSTVSPSTEWSPSARPTVHSPVSAHAEVPDDRAAAHGRRGLAARACRRHRARPRALHPRCGPGDQRRRAHPSDPGQASRLGEGR